MSVIPQNWPVVLRASKEADSLILKEFAEFWKVPFTIETTNEHLPIVQSGGSSVIEQSRNRTIVITPRGRGNAIEIAQELGLRISVKNTTIALPVDSSASVSVETELYEFSGSKLEPILSSSDSCAFYKLQDKKLYLLSLDLVGEYSKRLHEGFEESPSWKFRLASKLPFSYQSIPHFLRDRAFRSSHGIEETREGRLGPIECLRTVFLASLVKSLGPTPRVGFWKKGRRFALSVTHDVESESGLKQGAVALLEIEESLGIRSTWNLPSDRYPISPESLELLKKSGEIGAHDTRHDGRLVLLGLEEKTRRLSECRERLESITNAPISGFRAPLLQHSPELAVAEAKAGFTYDSSCPSWEILSPTSMRPHGAGTIFPFEISGILEIPVSLPQDHQLIRVAGQTPSESVDRLLSLSQWIKALGGPCVLLVHPDYEFANEALAEYRRLLENFASDPECEIVTMRELSDWWKLRARARWTTTEGKLNLIGPEGDEIKGLTALTVTGYGSNGFVTETGLE